MMRAPLLETKLFPPRARPGSVRRPRLSARLDAGSAAALTLVSAPAGFGKTTLLADWLVSEDGSDTGQRSVAWLSLDRGDDEPRSFWSCVIAALQRVAPGVGVSELALLAASQPPPIELLLTTLLNDLGSGDGDLVLVLDDFHLIESRDVQDAMSFLLDRLPPRLRLVIVTRADPPLPLARLRARGELVEIRAADLRFTPEECAAYLTDTMGLALTADDVAALDGRTEGWIAALQLAALSLQGRDDVTGFIDGFTGDDRYIVDYLLEEVLRRQPQRVRDFLLQTSLLSRLEGSLCDAVTGSSGGRATLEALDRGNLFVVPLDDRRRWYRYHHLFADVLRSCLAEETPDLVPLLHRRASDWYFEHGDLPGAVEHALAGGHVDRAAAVVEMALPALSRDRQEAAVRAWVEQLPEAVLAARPVLSNGYAGALLSTGRVEGVERHLRDAERWLDSPGDADHAMQVVDEEGWRLLPAGVAVHRAGLALTTGDPTATVTHAQRALGLLQEEDHLGRAAASALIGLASWSGGELERARGAYETSLVSMHRAGHLADVLGLSIALADIQVTQGDLRAAMRTYERGLALDVEGRPPLRGTADMYVGMSTLHCEADHVSTASRLLARSDELGQQNGLPQNPYRWRVAMARVRAAEGDLAAADALLEEAERVYVGDFSPDVRPVSAVRARVWLRQGRVDEVFAWAGERGLAGDDALSYAREHEHVTLARALIARRSLDEASDLLDRLLRAASAGRRTGTVIEILLLQAVAAALRDEVGAGLVPLERALTLAGPQGYLRLFVEEGAPLRSLLEAAAQRGIASAYVARLLSALAAPSDDEPALREPVDPLSRRELEVLRLLGTDLRGQEIADHLVVSLNTVRTHTKSIYAKLAVNTRRAAVRRGEELDLLSRSRTR
jgi:LuxR family maltose regulon positive regulatory protein